jgi:hypothetical protein
MDCYSGAWQFDAAFDSYPASMELLICCFSLILQVRLKFLHHTIQRHHGNKSHYAGTLHFTSSDIQAILPGDTTLTDGFGTLSATLKTAGIQTITATDTANNEITGDSNQISVNANTALPGYIVISPSSATIAAGGSQTFTAELFDEFGNSLGDITNFVNWNINSGAGTFLWTENSVVVYKAGDWTITLSQYLMQQQL